MLFAAGSTCRRKRSLTVCCLAVPFELFPDVDCLMDIEFYNQNMTKLNWSNGVPFHPRG